jgi:hypothetical protein
VKATEQVSRAALPDGVFQTKNRNLGKFWRALQRKMFVYFMDIRSILRSFDISYGPMFFVVIWYIFPRVGNSTKKNLATWSRAGSLGLGLSPRA